MNLRKSLVTTVAAIGVMASVAAPMAIAAPPPTESASNNTTDAQVVIASGGTFDAYFCVPVNLLLQTAAPTNMAAGLATGTMGICYDDTLSFRPEFNTQIQATSPFTSSDAIYNTPIAASNFRITETDNVIQTHWSSDGHGHTPFIGDIGSFAETGYVAQSSLPVAWPGPNNTLDIARNVQFGYNGIGTGLSVGAFDVALTIPSGTAPGTYEADVTLTIIAGTQTKP